MFFGYNTNGFGFHRLEDAVELIAELGYRGVGITLDHHALNPFDADIVRQVGDVAVRLERLKLRCVIETGARFLLDVRHKHRPTLLEDDIAGVSVRLGFLLRSLAIAADLNADALSFWSGAGPVLRVEDLHDRLASSLEVLLRSAESRNVKLAFEPEPGMFIDTLAAAKPVLDRFNHPLFGLTVDIGHLHCQREGDIARLLESVGNRLFNVHAEDMRAGVHDHLPFGTGEMDFPPIFAALQRMGYSDGVYVELSRHGHDAVETARRSLAFLNDFR